MDAIFNHRSIRKYQNKPVDEEILDKILKAAIRGSNTGNMQLYSIIVTRDEVLKEKLWEAHFKQDMVKQAPVVLTFCADINRFHKWTETRNAGKPYDNLLWWQNATIDTIIAAERAALEAEEHGLGICYLGTTLYNADKIIEILDLPQGVMPVTTLVVGYPDEDPPLTDRLPLEAVVHYDKYKDYSVDDIDRLFAQKENSEQAKKFAAENNLDNLAQVFTKVRYKEEDNIFFSKKLVQIALQQGFMNHNK